MKLLLNKSMKKLQAVMLMFALIVGNISGAVVTKAETARLGGEYVNHLARGGMVNVDFVNEKGTKLMNTVSLPKGSTVQKPAEMKYKVKSWKIQGGGQYDFSSQVNSDLTLEAEYGDENIVPGQYETGASKTPRVVIPQSNYNSWDKSLNIYYDVSAYGVSWDDYCRNLNIYKLNADGTREKDPIPFTEQSSNIVDKPAFWIKRGNYLSVYKYQLSKNDSCDLAFLMVANGYKTVRITVKKAKGDYFRKIEFKEYFDDGYKYQTKYDVNFLDENNQPLAEIQKVVENDKVKDPIKDEISYWYVKGDPSKTPYDFSKKVTGPFSLVGVKEKKMATVIFSFRSKGTESLPQEVVKLTPDNAQIPYGTRNYIPNPPAKTEVKVKGDTWKFIGWDPDKIAEVKNDLNITGIWECKHADVQITFKAVSDTLSMDLHDEISGIMPNNESCAYGADYTIKPPTQLEVVDSHNGGVWEFTEWTVDNNKITTTLKNVTKNTTVTGHWKFKPKENVKINLKFENQNPNESLPNAVTKLLLTNTDSVKYGYNYNPDRHNPKPQDVIVEGGIWNFKGWNPKEAKQVVEEKTFKGIWEFKERKPVTVSFEFVSDSTKELPNEVKALKLENKSIPFGKTYSAPNVVPDTVKTSDGEVWKFAGWEPTELELTQDKVTFKGKWKFTGLKYTVQYYNEGSEVTPLASAELQTDENCKVDLMNNIDKTKGLDERHKFSKITYKGEDKNPADTVTIDKDNRIIKVYYKKNITKLTITKQWHDIDTSKQRIPNEIKVDVLRRVNDNDQPEKAYPNITISKKNNWTATLDVDIQPKDLNDNDYTYLITEQHLPGFVPTYENDNQNGAVAEKDNEGNLSAEVINVSDNSSYIDLNVVKTDDTGLKLSGAVFRMVKVIVDYNAGVVTEDDSYVREITTGDNGKVTFRLMEGIYKLTEEKAPKGYMIDAKEYYIEAADKGNGFAPRLINDDTDDKKIEFEQADGLSAASYKLSIVNQKIKDNSIYKTDQNGKAVAGAKFDLYKKMSDDDKYVMNIEVDNSQIGVEPFEVTAQLYGSDDVNTEADIDNEAQKKQEKKLSDTDQEETFTDLSADIQYKVKFIFDNRFEGSVFYDKDTATVILRLTAKNNGKTADKTSLQQPAIPEDNETQAESAVGSATDEVTVPVESQDGTVVDTQDTAVTDVADTTANPVPETLDNNAGTVIQSLIPAGNSNTASVASEAINLQTAAQQPGFVKIKTGIVSEANGEINLGALEEGEYYLQETEVSQKTGGHYDMPNVVFNFMVMGDGEIVLPLGSTIVEENISTGKTYRIINQWIADPVPDAPSNPDGSYIEPYAPTEEKGGSADVNTDTIADDDTPLSNADNTASDIEDEDIIIGEDDAELPEEDTLDEDDVPLAAIPKTGEKAKGYGNIIYLSTILLGSILMLAKIAESLKKRR